mmetsp:Transcript_2577/g.5735  ORF Transcript_2577/g.5735 Transcript_2577/m.5735 type:complete len:219 (-) Transcript_2577:887-1543(-)
MVRREPSSMRLEGRFHETVHPDKVCPHANHITIGVVNHDREVIHAIDMNNRRQTLVIPQGTISRPPSTSARQMHHRTFLHGSLHAHAQSLNDFLNIGIKLRQLCKLPPKRLYKRPGSVPHKRSDLAPLRSGDACCKREATDASVSLQCDSKDSVRQMTDRFLVRERNRFHAHIGDMMALVQVFAMKRLSDGRNDAAEHGKAVLISHANANGDIWPRDA